MRAGWIRNWGASCGSAAHLTLFTCERVWYGRGVTLKQQIHGLVEELPDDSPVLAEMEETLRMNRALAEAAEDVRAGRIYEAEDFLAKVRERWPDKGTA